MIAARIIAAIPNPKDILVGFSAFFLVAYWGAPLFDLATWEENGLQEPSLIKTQRSMFSLESFNVIYYLI
jgi:hypothetical protein